MKDILSGVSQKVPLFLTQEKALKKILQEREKGDLAKARKTAVEALEKWPADYDLAVEAAQSCLDLSDYPQAATILKNAYKRHAARRPEILDMARAAFTSCYSTLLGGFLVESLLRNRNFDGVAEILKTSPESFVSELVKRGETRSKNLSAEGQDGAAMFAENELLLGMLRLEGKQHEKALESFGRALERLPGDAQAIGAMLVRIEHELPANALVKYYLGLASLLLEHPDKAELRFFQCAGLAGAPLDRILSALEGAQAPGPNMKLLKGEILIRASRADEGVALVRAYLEEEPAGGSPSRAERAPFAENRLAALPEEALGAAEVAFLYADAAAEAGLSKEALAALERVGSADPARAVAVIDWLERHEPIAAAAPGQHLLARLSLDAGRFEQAARAARAAVEMNAALVPGLTELVRARVENADAPPLLKALLAELYARSGDRTSAEEVFGGLTRAVALPDAELIALAGEIMRHCGVFLTGVVSALEIALKGGGPGDTASHVVSLVREKPEELEALADAMRELAESHEDYWGPLAALLDGIASTEHLPPCLRFAQAEAHLFAGGVERAVFEFDQLLMLDGGLRYRLIEVYKRSLARFDGNPTLHLALYQLYLEEDLLADAARHLCRTLELDPSQIRDVVARFGKLVEREPANLGVWEEMLKTSLATNRVSLAKEVLSRAAAALPPERIAALNVYGAKIAAADGKWDDALQCLTVALSSPEADVRALEGEIRAVVARDPANPQAQLLLGETLLRLGRDAEGVAAMRRCLEISPALSASVEEKLAKLIAFSIEPWLLSGILGEIAWLGGRADEALRLFAEAGKGPRASLAPLSATLERLRGAAGGDARLDELFARTLALEGRHAEAAAVLESLVARDPGATRSAIDVLLGIVAQERRQYEANRLLARICTRAGDREQARQAVVRILEDDTADPARLDAAAAEFLAGHETDPEFLVRYGELKARMGDAREALARFRTALDTDAGRAREILDALGRRAWPGETAGAELLLRADALIALGQGEEAFALFSACPAPDGDLVAGIVPRIERLAGTSPRREHFSLGASLLGRAGRIEDAERFIEKGTSLVGPEDALDLTIELAEMLHHAGMIERAARIFSGALAAATDRTSVYRRIEASTARWADREVATLAARLDAGSAGADDVARLVDLVLDHAGGPEALDMLSRSAVPRETRGGLLGSIYLGMDRPLLACAALDAAGDAGAVTEEARNDRRYLAGLAHERAGDFGRAAALFAAIAGDAGAFRDSRERAQLDYARFLETSCIDRPMILEKSDAIEIRPHRKVAT